MDKRRRSLVQKGNIAMRIPVLIISAASLVALGGIAKADDHLFNAQQHGLMNNDHSQGVEHSDEAPGQGSPFVGADTQTPASRTVVGDPDEGIPAKPHANIKCRANCP
jgi:hypothetical protein